MRARGRTRIGGNGGPAHTAGVILVVDDERTVRAVTKRIIEEIDAVIMDATMPRMSGEKALSEIYRMRADVPVVVMSGYPEEQAANRFSGLDFAGFLQKPYRATDLLAKLEKALTPA